LRVHELQPFIFLIQETTQIKPRDRCNPLQLNSQPRCCATARTSCLEVKVPGAAAVIIWLDFLAMMAFHRLHMAAPVYFSDCQQTVAPNSTGTCQASKGSLARLQVLVEGADFLGAEARWIFVKGFGHSFAGILCGRKGSRILIMVQLQLLSGPGCSQPGGVDQINNLT